MTSPVHERDILNQLLFPLGIQVVITSVSQSVQIYIDTENSFELVGVEEEWRFKILQLEGWPKVIFDAESDMDKAFELARDIMIWNLGEYTDESYRDDGQWHQP